VISKFFKLGCLDGEIGCEWDWWSFGFGFIAHRLTNGTLAITIYLACFCLYGWFAWGREGGVADE
jgi:hypothetical protein